jgi:hypothetical protein
MFVCEMNNEKNQIEGIGVIKNQVVHEKKYKIYSDSDYNRIIYRGSHWLSREELILLDEELVTIFDKMLFKGKSHLKRQSGITVITEKLSKKWNQDLEQLKRQIKNLFIVHFHVNAEGKQDTL